MSYINIKFPLTDDVENNFFLKRNEITMDAIKSNLMLLILTKKGSRYMLRDYGTNLEKFLFDPNDTLTESDIETEIKNTVNKYIPKLTINNVVFEKTDENIMIITINFVYSDDFYSETSQLTISF
jgi:phage baseplate assembly protein W